ncbi:IBR domain [Sesbania bispinosa]|nr:IBR domain [Sesbania bispinosa]
MQMTIYSSFARFVQKPKRLMRCSVTRDVAIPSAMTVDCSAMMLDDIEGQDIKESECPFCHRLFCARCHVPWHPGVPCEEFQKLNEDERGKEDLVVRELAHEKKWSSRCPKCKFNVENTEGYLHMICGATFTFAMRVEKNALLLMVAAREIS